MDGSWRKEAPVAGGLQIHLEVPDHAQVGKEVELGLWFRNAGQQKLRLYMIQSEVFRLGISGIRVMDAQGKLLAFIPDPHPHGYVVTEKDFHLLEPGAERRFTQTLYTKPLPPGDLRLEWTYENSITEWKGGAQTLDGPTKQLFEGKPIPYIWTGKTHAEQVLRLAP